MATPVIKKLEAEVVDLNAQLKNEKHERSLTEFGYRSVKAENQRLKADAARYAFFT